jgi:hypothetical protein
MAASAILGIATVAGCGVTPDERPRAIDPPRGPFQVIASPSPATSAGALRETLFLVRDTRLVEVTRRVDTPPTIDNLVAALVAGPTDAERDQGITSTLLGSTLVAAVHAADGRAFVELSAPIEGAARTDEVLAYGQIVCTLTVLAGITGVTFTRDGTAVGVPRADGSLSVGPLTATDYADLVG